MLRQQLTRPHPSSTQKEVDHKGRWGSPLSHRHHSIWYVSDMRNPNLLFYEDGLDSQLRARQQRVKSDVDSIPEQQFLISSDHELLDHIVATLTVEPLVLREDATTMNQAETQVFNVPGTRVDVDIPFTGDMWLFQYRTNPLSLLFPSAVVNPGYLRISISLPHDVEPESFKETYERELKLIRECVERSRNQVVPYNDSLPQLVQEAITNRRERLSKHAVQRCSPFLSPIRQTRHQSRL